MPKWRKQMTSNKKELKTIRAIMMDTFDELGDKLVDNRIIEMIKKADTDEKIKMIFQEINIGIRYFMRNIVFKHYSRKTLLKS
jgi:hypothetical protein